MFIFFNALKTGSHYHLDFMIADEKFAVGLTHFANHVFFLTCIMPTSKEIIEKYYKLTVAYYST